MRLSPKKTMKLLTSVIAVTFFNLSMPAAMATDLIMAWHGAQLHDPEFASAQANYEANLTHHDQARGLWLPQLALTVGAGMHSANSETSGASFSAPGFIQASGVAFDTSIHQGAAEQYALVARLPLLNRTLLTQSRQLDLSAESAEIAWRAARQQLALRVAQRYFDVLIAQETLRLLKRQHSAVEFTLTQVQDSFKLGSVPVTDTYEVRAGTKAIKAQIMAADMDVQLKQSLFSDLTGMGGQDLVLLVLSSNPAPVTLAGLEQYLSQARFNNPDILMQDKKLLVVQEEAQKHRAVNAASIDLVAQAGFERLHGNGDYGSAANTANNRMIGLQLTVPLFTGGIRSAKYSEAIHLIDQAKADGELLKQQIANQIRLAWLGITVGESRVTALIEAQAATLARLDATRLGHNEGDRTTLELLNAENEASSSELAVLQARTGVEMNRLRLAQLNGSLDEGVLASINQLLAQHSEK